MALTIEDDLSNPEDLACFTLAVFGFCSDSAMKGTAQAFIFNFQFKTVARIVIKQPAINEQ